MTNPSDRMALERRFLRDLDASHDHNARMSLLEGVFFSLGFSCILPGTVVVSFLKHYTSNQFVLNLPIFISMMMFAVCPFLASFVSGRFPSKKRAMLVFGACHRLAWVPVILTVVFLHDRPRLLVPAFLILYAIFYALWGWTSIFWKEMMGRVLHPAKQVTAMGMREAACNLAGVVSGFGALVVLAQVSFPWNYAILFGFFFVAFGFSIFFFLWLREAEYPLTHQEEPEAHLRSMLALPARDRQFRWYVVFIVLSYGYLFAGSLYTTIALDRFAPDQLAADRLTGIMTLLTLFSGTVCALLVGRLADRKGWLWGYLPGCVVTVVMPLWAIFATAPLPYLGMFLLTGLVGATWFMELCVTLNFGPPEKRHLYLAYLSLVKVLPIAVYTNAGGWVAQHVSPVVSLVVAAALCLAGTLVLVFKLGPEWRRASVISDR